MAGRAVEGPPARPAPGREVTRPAGKHATSSCLLAAPQGLRGQTPLHGAGTSAGLGDPRTTDLWWGCSPPRGCSPPMGMLAPISRDTGWHPHQEDPPTSSSLSPCLCGVPHSSPRLLVGAGGGLHPCKVPQWLQDGCPQRAGEDVARVALISLQGQGCARGWCSHGITVFGPGTMCGGCKGDHCAGRRELLRAAEPRKAVRSLFNPCKSKGEGCMGGECLGEGVFCWIGGRKYCGGRVCGWSNAVGTRWGWVRVPRSGAGCCQDQHNQPR